MNPIGPGENKYAARYRNIILVALILVASIYVVLRAICVSFTHDEAVTFLNYVNRPWEEVLQVNYTNNHFLNTLLTRLSFDVFGSSEFALRLPNVICSILFFIFGARLLLRLPLGRWGAPLAFTAFVCNAFLLEFFGLSRGYSISLGLLMIALYCLYRGIETKWFFAYGFTSVVLTALAVTANYTLLNFFLVLAAFFLCYGIAGIISMRKEPRKLLLYSVLYLLAAFAVTGFVYLAWETLTKLNENGSMDFGGNTGFWTDTVGSLVIKSHMSIFDSNKWLLVFVPVLAGILLVAATVLVLVRFVKKERSPRLIFTVFLLAALAGCATAVTLQHKLFGTPFLIDRTGIYFIPLFSLLVIVCFCSEGPLLLLRRSAAGLFFLPLIIAQFRDINLTKTVTWLSHENMRETVEQLAKDAQQKKPGTGPLIVAVSFELAPVFNYYVFAKQINWIQQVPYDQVGYRRYADYCLAEEMDPAFPAEAPFDVTWQQSGKKILENREPVRYRHVKTMASFDFEQEDDRPKVKGYRGKYAELTGPGHRDSKAVVDSVSDTINTGRMFRVSCRLSAEHPRVHISAVVSIIRNGQGVIWKQFSLSSFIRKNNEWMLADLRLVVEQQLLPGDDVVIYFMNEGSEPVAVDDLQVDEYAMEWP
ncbi:MAG: hypothetical protein FD123_77 [Bacteroidetes bacterium]|nr:MAG: hypothetical protein FD123_77 [Bacteroidota bacterium]